MSAAILPTPEPEPEAQARIVRLHEPFDASRYESAARLVMPRALSGMAFSATSPGGHTITIDVPEPSGGNDTGPQPLDLLLLSLGSCTGMDVIAILRKKRQQITGYTINVYGNQSKAHPQVYTEIVVEHIIQGVNVTPEAVRRSIELSVTKYCPVHAMLAGSTRIEHFYRVEEVDDGR
jgi:putative redox protein